jgi:hypothetical protein
MLFSKQHNTNTHFCRLGHFETQTKGSLASSCSPKELLPTGVEDDTFSRPQADSADKSLKVHKTPLSKLLWYFIKKQVVIGLTKKKDEILGDKIARTTTNHTC